MALSREIPSGKHARILSRRLLLLLLGFYCCCCCCCFFFFQQDGKGDIPSHEEIFFFCGTNIHAKLFHVLEYSQQSQTCYERQNFHFHRASFIYSS